MTALAVAACAPAEGDAQSAELRTRAKGPKAVVSTTSVAPASTTVASTSTTSSSTVAPTTTAPQVTTTTARPATTTTVPAASTGRLVFGLGTEASESRNARLTREAPVGMLSSWYNKAADLTWMTGWWDDVVPQTYAAGRAHHLIVWTGEAEGPLTTKYGPGCGRAYPLSDRFLGDMATLARTFAGRADGPPLYVSMFTEFQTFPCTDNAWNPNPETNNYLRALKDRYLETVAVFHQHAPNSRVSLSWGGWQARWDDPTKGGGRSLFTYFADALTASDFQSFQAMSSDRNVDDIRRMTAILAPYGPVMVSHYKPDNSSQTTYDADMAAVFNDTYITELTRAGLFAFSFMDQTNMNSSETAYQTTRTAVTRYGRMP